MLKEIATNVKVFGSGRIWKPLRDSKLFRVRLSGAPEVPGYPVPRDIAEAPCFRGS